MKSIVFISIILCLTYSQRLTADIYVESLCPYCLAFINNSLKKAINTPDIEKMVHIRIIPYGNTKRQVVDDKYVFTCQHGQVECYGDIIELCAQRRVEQLFAPNYEIPKVSIVHCIESKIYKPYTNDQFDDAVRVCAAEFNYNAADVIDCAQNEEGYRLHLAAAEETDRLDPSHLGVPWAVANKKFTEQTADEILTDLVQWACDNFQGQKVDACYAQQV